MKKQFVGALSSVLVLTIIVGTFPNSEAQYYYGHDGSVDEYLEKIQVKPYQNKKDYWVYIVKACATDHHLAIAGVILKSDIDEKKLGVNKIIPKGKCSNYGAVMKAKDGKTLGAELIERHEALDLFENSVKSVPGSSSKQIKSLNKDIYYYRSILGGLV